MKKNSTKIIIIVVSILVVLGICGGVLAYLYMSTDFLKKDSDLFMKYFSQNIDIANEIIDIKSLENYNNIIKENDKIEAETNIKLQYAEGGNVSNSLNNLEMILKSQKDNSNLYTYNDLALYYDNSEVFEVETIKNEELIGIRFTDVVKQFLTIKDDNNSENVAKALGIEKETLLNCFDLVEKKENNNIFSKDEINLLKTKYMELLKQNLQNVSYARQQNSVITVDSQTLTTNAYIMTITDEQIFSIIQNVLTSLKQEEILLNKMDLIEKYTNGILTREKFIDNIDELINQTKESANTQKNSTPLKITAYEQNGDTVRTIVEKDGNKIILENKINNNIVTSNVQIDSLETNIQKIEISKSINNNVEKYQVIVEFVDEDKEKTNFTINVDINNGTDEMKLNANLSYNFGIKEVALDINNKTKTVEELTNKQELNSSTNVVLNDLDENTLKRTIDIVSNAVIKKFRNRMETLQTNLGIKIFDFDNTENAIASENTMSQIEVNRFNAKFEFYTGESVTFQNVNKLLDVVRTNLESVEFLNENSVKLNILQNIENSKLVDEVISKLDTKGKYTVIIKYDDSTNLISYITITNTNPKRN